MCANLSRAHVQVGAMLAAGDLTGNRKLNLTEFIRAVQHNDALLAMYWIPSGATGRGGVVRDDYY